MRALFLRERTAQHSIVLLRSLFLGVFVFLCSSLVAQNQPIIIQGTVVDEQDNPLIGVSILDQTTGKGTISDEKGRFSLQVASAQSSIRFSYVGFISQTVVPGNQRELKVVLSPSSLNLDEVVVVGFGTVKKRDLTGAVSSIKPTEITLLPTHNALESLEGRVPGMDIVRSSGKAGA
jgi:hypothetical protein